MKHKVFKLIFDFEKEEKWLNEMSAKGLQLVAYCIPQYLFEDGKPGEYTYRVELMEKHPSHPEGRAYINFLEETGVECVDTFWRWAYFRKKASEGPFDLYTDLASKIRHYKRIIALLGAIVAMNAGWAAYLVSIARHGEYVIAAPNLAMAAFLTGLAVSYGKRVARLKKARKLRE